MKKPCYVAPKIGVTIIQIEDSIAVASAMVSPLSNSSELIEEWENDTDYTESHDWTL